ncbi:MAG TPA: BatA domain-containing protein [Pirellulales bacterium]|jgi:hypothetical protein|nr:BatA domain-containing protein [Pirellulales bacterium]
MSGLGLVNVGFLAATLAVAVPVLIHLLFRRRARVVEIGTLRFLRIVVQDNAHRRKLRRWLLLALRVAGLLLLALVFARPYWSQTGRSSQDHELIVLIDQSASMDARENGPSAFARAQDAAAKLLAGTAEGTVTHLAYFDARGVFPAEDLRDVSDRGQRARSAGGLRVDHRRRPGFAGTDYTTALAWARDLLAQSHRTSRRLVLMTDLQRSGLGHTPVKDFPNDVEIELIDVGKPLARNLAIDDVQVRSRDIRPGQPLVVVARVLNAGAFTVRKVPVKFELSGGGRKYEERTTVTLVAGSREVVHFEVVSPLPGLYQGFVEVEGGDPLKADDRRWLAFDARAVDRVLLVDGEPGVSVFTNETYYLEAALRLRPGVERNEFRFTATPYEPQRVPADHGENWPDLAPYRVVVLANVASLAGDHVSSLAEYVAEGGSLLWFLGDQVRPTAYEPLDRLGLVPGSVAEISDRGVYRFETWDKEHPIFRTLSDPQHGDLRSVRLQRIVELKPDSQSRVLASDQDGHPLVVEGRLGKGKILLAAMAADRDWGDWPTNRLYLPLVHQAVGYLAGRLSDAQRVAERPAGSFDDGPPGVTQEGDRLVVCNGDPSESQIERVSAERFRTALGLPQLAKAGDSNDGGSRPPPPTGSQRPDEKWRYLLWGLVVVLVAETFLANRTHA